MVGRNGQPGERQSREIPSAGSVISSGSKPDQGKVLANKLRLTSLVLGCSTNKELCSRFASVNPSTAFVAQNAYKWLGGKAMPRVSSVYEDWAQVLGGGVSAPFIASSSFDEFAAALGKLYSVPQKALASLQQELAPPVDPSTNAEGSAGDAVRLTQPADQFLVGDYLALSSAWSRGEAGRLIIGYVRVEAKGRMGLQVDYCESLFNRLIVMNGALVCDGRSAQSAMTCAYTRRLIFLALQVPPPPANLIGGIMSGAAIHDHEARSLATRIVFIRAHCNEDALSGLSGYIDATESLVAEKLTVLGYRSEVGPNSAAARLIGFLTAAPASGLLEASPEALGNLGLTLDRLVAA